MVVCSDQGRTSSHADTDSESGGPAPDAGSDVDGFISRPVTVQQESVYSSEPAAAPPPRVVTSHIPTSGVLDPTGQPSHVTIQPRSVVSRLSCTMLNVLCSSLIHSFLSCTTRSA